MKMRRLGETDLVVSEISLGGLFVSSFGTSFDEAENTISRALDLGINCVDTAPNYLDSEAVLGRVLGDRGGSIILPTKLGGHPKPFEPQDRDCLMRSVENSLCLLNREQLDILMIRLDQLETEFSAGFLPNNEPDLQPITKTPARKKAPAKKKVTK